MAQNLIENPSFEFFNNCTNYNQFQCGCYPDAFYEGCLQGPWHNATGSSALSNIWLNNGPMAIMGSYYAQTQQRIKKNLNGTTTCNLFETFYYNFNGTTINKLFSGQPYQIRLWYYGHNINLQPTDFTFNVKVDAITGFTNQQSPIPTCTDQIPTTSENVLSATNITNFSKWVLLENSFTLNSDKNQLWFRPEVNESSVNMENERKIHVFFDNVTLTCNSLITNEIQYTQVGNNFTFTLTKISGPADANIASVKWTFPDGSEGTGNPFTTTIEFSGPFKVTASFTDTRGCTGNTTMKITPVNCGCTGTTTFISNNQTWSTPTTLTGNITIFSGGRLTLNNTTLKMSPGCKILVTKGARLNVQGSTIDVNNVNQCNPGRWDGIEVWGAGNGVQHPDLNTITQNNTYPANNQHGVVLLSPGSVIRGATTGIHTMYNTAAYMGGIVMAFQASFIDNIEGVIIGPYANDNVNRFINCSFIGNSTSSSSKIYAHKFGLKLINNRGVQVGTADGSVTSGFKNMTRGIIAENAGYYLSGHRFDQIAIATDNYSTNTIPRSVVIGQTKPGSGYSNAGNVFSSCTYGIKNNGINQINVLGNSFLSVGYGVDQRGAGQANIEQNSFSTLANSVYLQNTENPAQKLPIRAHCNTYNYGPIGINAFQNNQSATFEEELFNLTDANNRDVVVAGNPNVQGTMTPVMGSPTSGVVNIFSTVSKDFTILPTNTAHHTYYAQAPLNNTYNTRWVPRCPDNPDPLYDEECTIEYNYTRPLNQDGKIVYCLGAQVVEIPSQYPCRNFSCLTQLVADYNSFLTLHTNYLSLGEYWNLLKQKESAYNTLFVLYTEQRMQDSMLLLLNLENNESNHERRIQFTVNESQFGTARSQVGTLPTNTRDEIDRVVLWYIIIDQSEQDTAFVLMPDYRAFVEELAYNNRLYTPRAQAILTALDGRIFEPVQPDLSGGSVRLGQINKKEIKIYPNPSAGYINIELRALNLTKPASFKIFNTIGEIKAIGTLNEEIKTLDFTNMHPGAYTVQVTTMDAEVLYAKFIIIK